MEILKIEEITWKLKSRIRWLQEWDLNTKFFHNTANAIRNRNTIWTIKNEKGTLISNEDEIRKEAHKYFSDIYKADNDIKEECQSWMMQHIHNSFDEEEMVQMNVVVTKEEVICIIKSFAHDKCPRPYGWPAEFY